MQSLFEMVQQVQQQERERIDAHGGLKPLMQRTGSPDYRNSNTHGYKRGLPVDMDLVSVLIQDDIKKYGADDVAHQTGLSKTTLSILRYKKSVSCRECIKEVLFLRYGSQIFKRK